MVQGRELNTAIYWPGRVAQGLVLCAVAAGLVPLISFVVGRGALQGVQFDESVLGVLTFTLKQAALSTFLSVLPGLFVARALARQQFWGRRILLQIFAVPLALPAIVAVLGLSVIYGSNGLLGSFIKLYGLPGILLAHVFFNLPLATRLFFEALEAIAPDNFRLAAQLSFSNAAIFRHVEWPALRPIVPQVSAIIFLLCASSFVIVLTLGGPSATTLEVAIYQSLRLDFDVARALELAILQVVLCVGLVAVSGRFILQHSPTTQTRIVKQRFDRHSWPAQVLDIVAIAIAAALVLPPLLAIFLSGIVHLNFTFAMATAFLTSAAIGAASATITVALAWSLARSQSRQAQGFALAGLIVPPAVIATGWFLLMQRFAETWASLLLPIIFLNALMALPFAVSALAPALARLGKNHERLCEELAISGWNRWWRIDLPLLKRPLMQALLMALVLSLGDLTAITLLGSQGLVTLPSLIHSQMGHYRADDASGTAVLLAGLCFVLAALAQRLGGFDDQV